MVQRRKLNRGLEALLGAGLLAEKNSGAGDSISHNLLRTSESPTVLSIEKIVPGKHQPRRQFEDAALKMLAKSIQNQGVLQPILVRKLSDNRFEILSGERRWRACQLAGLVSLPALVKDVSDQDAIAIGLIENIQREDLNPVEEGLGLKRLQQEFGLSQEQIGEAVGRSRSSVANMLRLLNLEPKVLAMLSDYKLDLGHAKVLLGLAGSDQVLAASQVIQRSLTVRQTEILVSRWGIKKVEGKKLDPDVKALQQELSGQLGAKVRIRHRNTGAGRLEIEYTSLDELDGIIKKIR